MWRVARHIFYANAAKVLICHIAMAVTGVRLLGLKDTLPPGTQLLVCVVAMKEKLLYVNVHKRSNKMNAIVKRLERISSAIPEFCTSHWLLRIPLALLFIQMGLMKLPIDPAEAESYGLSVLVWWVVALGELGSGLGLIAGGLFNTKKFASWIGDTLTRFSGFTIGCITTGVIWIGEPESFLDVILYDNLHVFMWVGGLFFALRGNRA